MEEKTGTVAEKSGEKQQTPQGKAPKNRKKGGILIPVLIALVLIGAGVGYYLYDTGSRYFKTDNAKVTAKMYTITPVTSGKLLEWKVREGEQVRANQNLGRQETLPYIVSPIDGTVVKNNAIEGQVVAPTTQLAIVADTGHPYIGVNIEETEIARIKVGQKAEVRIDAYPGRSFSGVVTEIDRTTQQFFSAASSFSTSGTYTKVTQLIPVKVVIENPEQLPLTFGMNATVRINVRDIPQETQTTAETSAAAAGTAQAADYSGSIEAVDQIAVLPSVSGKVTAVHFKVGQSVKAGDLLFEIDSSDLALQVEQARSTVAPLQTASNEASANYNRMQKLFEAGAVSKVERDGAKAKADSAASQLAGAKASLDLIQKKLDDCTVEAPMSGVVAAKNISPATVVSPPAPALTLINSENVLVRIQVTESAIAGIRLGDSAQVQVQAANVTLKGTIDSIAPACDAKTGLFPVEILIQNTDGVIKPGMKADVTLAGGQNHG
jgi:RND family efflux transporter MFP subunit